MNKEQIVEEIKDKFKIKIPDYRINDAIEPINLDKAYKVLSETFNRKLGERYIISEEPLDSSDKYPFKDSFNYEIKVLDTITRKSNLVLFHYDSNDRTIFLCKEINMLENKDDVLNIEKWAIFSKLILEKLGELKSI